MTQQDSDFNIGRVVLISLCAATLGATVMLIFSSAMSLDWFLWMPMTLHLAVAFAIAGGWLAASFAADSEMDNEAVEHTLATVLSGDGPHTINKPSEISGPNPHSTAA